MNQHEIQQLAEELKTQAERCGTLRLHVASLRNARDGIRDELSAAQLDAQLAALEQNGSLGRNADERKLRIEHILRQNQRVTELRNKLNDIEAELQEAEANLNAALDQFSAIRNTARLYAAFLTSMSD